MANTATVYADADTHISSTNPTTNYGTSTTFRIGDVYNTEEKFRTVIRFPFTSIPHGSTILSATLYVRVVSETTNNARTIGVYRVLTNWAETAATWNSPWVTSGLGASDYNTTAIGSFTADADGAPLLKVVPLTTAVIQGMFDNDYNNYGFFMRVTPTEDADAVIYASRTYDVVPSYRPYLSVTYIAGGHYWIIG